MNKQITRIATYNVLQNEKVYIINTMPFQDETLLAVVYDSYGQCVGIFTFWVVAGRFDYNVITSEFLKTDVDTPPTKRFEVEAGTLTGIAEQLCFKLAEGI